MIAISGASGIVYARRLMEVIPGAYDCTYLTASDNALAIAAQELGINALSAFVPPQYKGQIKILDPSDMFAPPASGSHQYDGLIIIPCSMGMAGRIASGMSSDLITRAADVCLKEKRKLILVIRETPLSLVHLRNLTALTEAGATILPAAPAFYGKPDSINDLVDFIIDRVFISLGIDLRLSKGWGE